MSEIKTSEKKLLEDLFGMRSGYILDSTNATFAEFFREHGIDIYSEPYAFNGDSKARRFRAFWEVASDADVAEVLSEFLACWRNLSSHRTQEELASAERCEDTVRRLRAKGPVHPSLEDLKQEAEVFNAQYLSNQIRRMQQSLQNDPELAIGTAKELVETCCRTILSERCKPLQGKPDIPTLAKATLRELKLVPEGISEQAKGAEIIKRLLSNLATIVQGTAELRGLYGTGHGKDGRAQCLKPRHAKLAVGAATTLATFLFETHKEKGAE